MTLLKLLTLALTATTPTLSLTIRANEPLAATSNNTDNTDFSTSASAAYGSSLLSSGATFRCNERGFTQSLKVSDCIGASIQFYAGHETARFHIGGDNNAFRLPQGAEDGRCAIEVKMNGEVDEVGSWTGVKLAIHELITICGDGSATKTWTGYMNTGINGRLRVEIRKGAGVQSQGPQYQGNGTLLSAGPTNQTDAAGSPTDSVEEVAGGIQPAGSVSARQTPVATS